MNIYQQQILDHYKNPQHSGKPTWVPTYTGKLVNYSCGDEVVVYLLVEDGVVKDYSFEGRGCSISIAAASLLSEQIIGMNIEDVKKLDYENIHAMLEIDLTITRQKCALLALEAIKKSLEVTN